MNEAIYFRVNKANVVSETFEDEVILVNLENGNYYSLNNSGILIWNFIENTISVNEIITMLSNKYADSSVPIEASVRQLISDLLHENLIEPAPSEECRPAAEDDIAVMESPGSAFEVPILNRYTDMQNLLLMDPIHDVDETGWPKAKQEING